MLLAIKGIFYFTRITKCSSALDCRTGEARGDVEALYKCKMDNGHGLSIIYVWLLFMVLGNLIAYGHPSSSYKTCGHGTSYTLAMDMLVDIEEDVAKLIESKIIVNHLGSNENTIEMINNICKELPFRRFYYFDD
ncbi:unnamed protein product [Lactuca saligna]|uniref:Uncharacterized protein n=1 Tax=Lactuca saligna TaxID=75948 RepID=A0AA35ZTK0_LACSI|nr:unnamed protein product [Lactuca saligna]